MGSSLLILDHLWALGRKSEYSSSHRFMQIQKTYKNLCKINQNRSGLIKSSCWVILGRPGSNMVHFGPSRRFMGADLARPGSIMVHFGTSRQSMEVDLACPGSILVHFGTSRPLQDHLKTTSNTSRVTFERCR